jgi:hypothetical protein
MRIAATKQLREVDSRLLTALKPKLRDHGARAVVQEWESQPLPSSGRRAKPLTNDWLAESGPG